MSTSPEKDDEVHVSRWTRYVKPTQMRVDPPSRQQSIHPSGGPSIQSDKGTKSGHDFQIPPSSAGMLLEELSPSSLEYKKLHDRIKTGCPHVEISKIEKVNDPRRRKKYESHRCFLVDSKVLLKSYFGMSRSLTMVYQVDANERQLFHGASSDSITKILRQGFNRNYAGKNGTSFGIGTYFALDPGYSVNYAHPDEQGLQRMLLCDVLVGEAAAGSAGLRAPPPAVRPAADCGGCLQTRRLQRLHAAAALCSTCGQPASPWSCRRRCRPGRRGARSRAVDCGGCLQTLETLWTHLSRHFRCCCCWWWWW